MRDGTIVETEDGELIAVDRDGEFYANADSLGFVDNKPNKQAVDRLVGDLRQAEDARMRRRKGGDEEDVTYINDKNKQFNQKLARYYNKVNFRTCSLYYPSTCTDDHIVYRRNQGQFRKRNYGLKLELRMQIWLDWAIGSQISPRFFVTLKCGVMGMELDVAAGGDKGFFIDKMVYTTFLIPLFFSALDVLRTEWSLRERKSLMFTVFNIKKNT